MYSLSLLKTSKPLLNDYTILLADPIVPKNVFLTNELVPLIIPIPPCIGPLINPYLG